MSRRYFRRLNRVIAVSERTRSELMRFGFDGSAVHVVNAYLPPEPDEIAHSGNLEMLEAFGEKFGVLATANAWALNFFRGEDLYGIDLCIRMLGAVRKRHPELGLVLALPLGRGTDYLAEMQRQAEELEVTDRILWLLDAGAYHPILKSCDLFLRPTNTDGFCISIAESFEFGVPVVASDAVTRPSGCLLFKNRDVPDLTEKVEYALGHLEQMGRESAASREPDHFEEIVKIYQAMAASR